MILVPFRDAALKVVEVMMQLICPGDGVRFLESQHLVPGRLINIINKIVSRIRLTRDRLIKTY